MQLGYQLCEGQEGMDFQRYELTLERFEQKAGKVQKAVHILAGSDHQSKVLFEPGDYKTGLAQKFENLLNTFAPLLEREETHEGVWYREPETDTSNK